MKVEDPKMLAI